MKTIMTSAALVAGLAACANADSLNNTGGLDWTVQRAAVHCDGVSPASAMIRRGAIYHLVPAAMADACADLIDAGHVFVMNAGQSPLDLGDVEAFIASDLPAIEYLVQLRTSGGDPIYQLDANGDPVLDANGDPIIIGYTRVREYF